MEEVNWRELVGKRILYQERYQYFSVSEATVLEVSPSGEYIKLETVRSDGSTYTGWVYKYDVKLVEVIGDKK